MLRRALGGEPLTVYGDGGHLRDYLYVDDAARAFLAVAAVRQRLNGQHFVVGTGQGHTVREAIGLVAERVAARTGRRVTVRHVPTPAGLSPIEDRDFVADTRRFRELTGWQPRVSLSEGIDRTLDWLLSQEGIGA
jgi:nucleoside-diphosphate-sugar epimerase